MAIAVFGLLSSLICSAGAEETKVGPRVVGHRGLLLHAPENTLANFAACLDLRLGFEFDVQRSQDGQLICIHDDTLDRTTNGQGPVASMSLESLQKLDAGGWFDPAFRGERIPTIDAVFVLLAKHSAIPVLAAVDLKADDANLEKDTVQLAQKHQVVDQLLFIGRAIRHADVRERLRAADAKCHVAVLANVREELKAAIVDENSDWVYVRFVPDARDIEAIHSAGKKVFISGPIVTGREEENWKRAIAAGVDAILSDYALECRQTIRSLRRP
jgi:glycerophosphoryl diester phosphodiesterase